MSLISSVCAQYDFAFSIPDDSKMVDIKITTDKDGNESASLRRQTVTGRVKGNLKDKKNKLFKKK